MPNAGDGLHARHKQIEEEQIDVFVRRQRRNRLFVAIALDELGVGIQNLDQNTDAATHQGVIVRNNDPQWFNLVKWVGFAMLNAEELGVTKANVDEKVKSDNPEIKRLLGTEGKFGEQIGLTGDWVVRIVKLVGNYGESFERNVGSGSLLKIARGQNALWTKGGLQYAPPVR